MRVIIQRVLKGAVCVGQREVASIGPGMVVLVGITHTDTKSDADFISKKILGLRLWDGDDGRAWKCNVKDKGFDVLLVSQFTLYGTLNGNKPDFRGAMDGKRSQPFYQHFVESVRSQYSASNVFDGEFGADMQVQIYNDGPVTLTIDSATTYLKKKGQELLSLRKSLRKELQSLQASQSILTDAATNDTKGKQDSDSSHTESATATEQIASQSNNKSFSSAPYGASFQLKKLMDYLSKIEAAIEEGDFEKKKKKKKKHQSGDSSDSKTNANQPVEALANA